MRILDTTLATHDEQFGAESEIADSVEVLLNKLKFDTYTHQYIIRVTVDRVDDTPEEEVEDE